MLGSLDHKPKKNILLFELSYDPIFKSPYEYQLKVLQGIHVLPDI